MKIKVMVAVVYDENVDKILVDAVEKRKRRGKSTLKSQRVVWYTTNGKKEKVIKSKKRNYKIKII